MRLSHLARKYDVPVQVIIDYLQEIAPSDEPYNPNARLNEETLRKVALHFEKEEELTSDQEKESSELSESSEAESEPSTPLLSKDAANETINGEDSASGESSSIIQEAIEINPEPDNSKTEEEPVNESTSPESSKEDEHTIATDQLLELIESEDTSIDLSRITKIKAPKKELEGLKVIGKIELPEPKKKLKEEKPDRSASGRRGQKSRSYLSDEEKEKRRLAAKKKREAEEARRKKRNKEKEKRRKKARKRAHYKQSLKPTATESTKPKKKKFTLSSSESGNRRSRGTEKKSSVGLLGRFWQWLNPED